MAGKKFTLLTIKQKAEILRKQSEGFSIDALAKSFHVHRSTINRIKNKKNTIRKFLAHAESGPGKRKTFKPAELPKMERALMKWFANQRAKNLPITYDMLKQKAKFLHSKIQKKSGTSMLAMVGLQTLKKIWNTKPQNMWRKTFE